MDEKQQENASTLEELENTGSSDDEDSLDEETVEPSEEEEHQDTKKPEEFADDLKKEQERLGKKIDKERGKRIEAEKGKDEILEEVDRKLQESEKRILKTQIAALADSMAGSIEERDLILHYYDNNIVPSGNIREDLENARALANRKRVKGELSELRKLADSQQNRETISGAGAPKESKRQQTYSQEIIEAAKFAGVTPEEFVNKQEQH